jgi:hypothetical protein
MELGEALRNTENSLVDLMPLSSVLWLSDMYHW